MMTSPYAKVYSRGIVQSCATETMGVKFNAGVSTALAENILKNLNITPDNIGISSTCPRMILRKLRQRD
ncbi:MAG: hypothetical protein ACLT5A_12120 [Clostridiaceae bacterium]